MAPAHDLFGLTVPTLVPRLERRYRHCAHDVLPPRPTTPRKRVRLPPPAAAATQMSAPAARPHAGRPARKPNPHRGKAAAAGASKAAAAGAAAPPATHATDATRHAAPPAFASDGDDSDGSDLDLPPDLAERLARRLAAQRSGMHTGT